VKNFRFANACVRFAAIALLLFAATAQAQQVTNASFETPAITSNTDSLRPTGATWSFTGQSGIRNNNAPNGSVDKQAAFLSAAPASGNNNFGVIAQNVTFAPGTYFIRYAAAIKTPSGRPQPLKFSVNGAVVGGTVNPRYIADATTGGYETRWTQPFTIATAGSYALRIEATNATNYGTAGSPQYAVAYVDAITIVSAIGAFANPGFETTAAWTLSTGATRTTPTNAPEGTTVLSLATNATATQSISLAAGRYSISLKSGKASVAGAAVQVNVASNGGAATTVATIASTTIDEYRSYSTPSFLLPSGTHVVTLKAIGGSVALDNVSLNEASVDALNAAFETPNLAAPASATAAGPTVANPTNASWSFSGTGGLIQGNAGASNTSAPRTLYGKQYLTLSSTGKVSQTLNFDGGIYVAVGQVAQGGVVVAIDGVTVGKLSASSLDFREVASLPFAINAGSRSLSIAVDTGFSPATPKLDEFRLQRIDLPPAVSITAPANGAVFQTGATVNITASAADADGLSSLTISRLPNGGTESQLATSATSPLSTSWSNSSANTYTIKAVATDASGTANATTISVRVNANPNAIFSISPSGPVVTSATAVTTTATVSSVSDADGSVNKVEFLLDGVVAASCTKTIPPATAPFTCAHSLAPRSTAYALAVRVTDNDGGVTTTSPLTIRINTAPTVTVDAACVAPCAGPATVNLTVTPADTDGGIAKVEFYDGATLLGNKTASPWTFVHTNVANGTHSYTAKVFDNDTASTTSTAKSITVAANAPSMSLGASCTAPCNAPATVTFTATPANMTGTVSKVEFYDGTTLLNTDTASPYAFTATSVAAGTRSYTAKVYVSNNATAVATSAAQSVRINALPSVTLTAACVSPCSAPATVNLTATPTDSDGTVAKVEFYDGATLLGSKTASPWTFAHTSVASGAHSYAAKVFDNKNAAVTSAAQAISVISACTTPVIAWQPPVSMGVIHTGSYTVVEKDVPLSVSAAAQNGCPTVTKVEMYSGTTLLGEAAANGSIYSYLWAAKPYGIYLIKARVYTGASFTDTSATNIKVNRSPLALGDSVTAATYAPATVALTARASDADGTITSVEFLHGTTLIGNGSLSNEKYTTTWSNVPTGLHTLSVRVTDNNGAQTTGSFVVEVPTPPTDVAAGKRARQSSANGTNAANLAVDASDTTAAITRVENSPWWEVDLGRGYFISSVEIVPASGVQSAALEDLLVVVSASPIAALDGDQRALHESYVDAAETAHVPAIGVTGNPLVIAIPDSISCCSELPRRYVRIWSRQANVALALASVRVMAKQPSLGARLSGISDGQTLVLPASVSLTVTPQRDTTTYPVAAVELFNGTTSLQRLTAAPYTFSFSPMMGDHMLSARAEWSDGRVAWTETATVRAQNPGDNALRIASPANNGRSFAGDAGIPGYFTLRGSWTLDATAKLDYLLECVPECATPSVWREIRQVNGSGFTALVPTLANTVTAARLNVRSTLQSGAQTQTSVNFVPDSVKLDLTSASGVDAQAQPLTGQMVGLLEPHRATLPDRKLKLDLAMEQVYVRDGQKYFTPHQGCLPGGEFWTRTSCENTPEQLRQFWVGYSGDDVDHAWAQGFTTALSAVNFQARTKTTDTSVDLPHPELSSPIGWFDVYGKAPAKVAGYKSFVAAASKEVTLRFGNSAPLRDTPIFLSPYIGENWGTKVDFWTEFVDYDDSRIPSTSNVRWLVDGTVVATASKCTNVATGLGAGNLHEHAFFCRGEWNAPAPGDYVVTRNITDYQGLTQASTVGTYRLKPWAVSSVNLPVDNATYSVSRPARFAFDVTATTPDLSRFYVLRDGVEVRLTDTTGRPYVETSGGRVELNVPVSRGAATYQLIVYSPTDAGTPSYSSPLRTLQGVDAQPPSVLIAAPTTNSEYAAPASIPISISVTPGSVDATISRVVIKANGTTISTLTTAPYNFTWSGVGLGTYTITAEATDSNGVTQESTSSVTVTVRDGPPPPPAVSLRLPGGASGFSSADVASYRACAYAVVNSPSASIVSVKLLLNGVETDSIPYSQPQTQVQPRLCLPADATEGTHTLHAVAVNTFGVETQSPPKSILIRPLNVVLVRPPEPGYQAAAKTVYSGDSLVFEATISDNVGAIAKVEFVEDQNMQDLNQSPIAVASSAPWRVSIVSTFGQTSRAFAACAYDVDGVRACAEHTTSVPFLPASFKVPVTLTGPSAATGTTPNRYSVHVDATNAGGGAVGVAQVALYDRDSRERLAESASTTSPYTFDVVVPLSRTVIASMQDIAGHETLSNAIAVTSSNGAPNGRIVQPANDSEHPTNAPVSIEVSASDSDGSVVKIELWMKNPDGDTHWMLASANAASLNYAYQPGYGGSFTVYAVVVDNVGARVRVATTTFRTRGDVTDPRYFVWQNFNAALKAGNKSLALTYLTPTAQENYASAIDVLIADTVNLGTGAVGSMLRIDNHPTSTEYLVARQVDTKRLIYVIRFVLMENGSWRLDAM
jgi:hypothetical protein